MDISYEASAPRKKRGQRAKDVRESVGILTIKLWAGDDVDAELLARLRFMIINEPGKLLSRMTR